jgi:ArsR family transcriptional regulator, arsenate/arsenite/antimonite-responsive transcriptional repressor
MERDAEIFQSLADPTRLRLIHLLERKGEICVCELVDALGVPQYNVSRHLRILQNAGWLQDRKVGKWVYYRIAEDLRPYQRSLLKAVEELRTEQPKFKKDEAQARERLKLREDGLCCVGLVSQIGPAAKPRGTGNRKDGNKA